MKFAICNETFQDWAFDRAFALAAACGYTGVEIAPFTLAPYANDVPAQRRAEVRRQAAAAGLEIIGLHWLLAKTEGFCLTSPESDQRRKTADYLIELTRLCGELGGRVMVLGSPQQRRLRAGVDKERASDYTCEALDRVLPVLEENRVVLAIEPLGPPEADFILTADEGAAIVRRLGAPQVQLHLDCKAMATERTPIPELIRKHSAILAHFHANDPNLQGPGFGKLDFVPIFAALKDVKYDGWVSVEVFDYAPGIERLVRESIEYMRDCDARTA